MNIIVNSKPTAFTGKKISELVLSLNMADTNGIALAVNDQVVPKNKWALHELKENDKILIIKATQGG